MAVLWILANAEQTSDALPMMIPTLVLAGVCLLLAFTVFRDRTPKRRNEPGGPATPSPSDTPAGDTAQHSGVPSDRA